jgi:hypothetical protein
MAHSAVTSPLFLRCLFYLYDDALPEYCSINRYSQELIDTRCRCGHFNHATSTGKSCSRRRINPIIRKARNFCRSSDGVASRMPLSNSDRSSSGSNHARVSAHMRCSNPSQAACMAPSWFASRRNKRRSRAMPYGDLDLTHIYCQDGHYTGIIDLGEIRGTGPYYDLGHFRFHDGRLSWRTSPSKSTGLHSHPGSLRKPEMRKLVRELCQAGGQSDGVTDDPLHEMEAFLPLPLLLL